MFTLQLDLFNQRIVEKREQQFQEMRTNRKQGEKGTDGTLLSPGINSFNPTSHYRD